MAKRTYAEECAFIEQVNGHSYRHGPALSRTNARRRSLAHTLRSRIKTGFVPNMRVPCMFYVNSALQALLFEELEVRCAPKSGDRPPLPAHPHLLRSNTCSAATWAASCRR